MSKINQGIGGHVAELIRKSNFAFIGTLMRDGSPHVTPVWIDIADNNTILINTSEGRIKQKMYRDPRVSISLIDDENPYSMATIRGRVIEQISDGANEHIDKLANKYLNR